MKNERRKCNTHYSGIEIPIPLNYILYYSIKVFKVAFTALMFGFLLWIFASFIDVNIHNVSAEEVNNLWDYNFFIYLERAGEFIQQRLA